MEISTIIGIVIVGLIVVYMIWYPRASSTGTFVILKDSTPGDVVRSFATMLPRSYNQPEGMTYSYSAWILVKDFTKGFGTRRRIFSKEDSPALYLDSTSNSFLVAVDTYGSTETILIPNIPAMKWVQYAMIVDQHSVDIYINGILRKHHTLAQLPQLNDAALSIGSQWDGVLSRLTYYPRALDFKEIKEIMKEPVPSDLQRDAAPPTYFDISWYIGRLYSA
jgi:hypothetical protein